MVTTEDPARTHPARSLTNLHVGVRAGKRHCVPHPSPASAASLRWTLDLSGTFSLDLRPPWPGLAQSPCDLVLTSLLGPCSPRRTPQTAGTRGRGELPSPCNCHPFRHKSHHLGPSGSSVSELCWPHGALPAFLSSVNPSKAAASASHPHPKPLLWGGAELVNTAPKETCPTQDTQTDPRLRPAYQI